MSCYFSRTRSNASYCDMSDRITWSPCFSPDFTSTVFTEVLPIETVVRVQVTPSASTLNRRMTLCSWP